MAGATRFRTIGFTVALLAGAAAATAGVWQFSWGPDARARRVSEIMSGKAPHPARNQADKLLDLYFEHVTKDGIVEQQQWATLELGRLASGHPGSLAKAAGGTTPDVRFAFLDVIENSAAYAELPANVRLEHAAVHVARRLDRENGRPYNDAQIDAMKSDQTEAVRMLRNALVAGHCGALAGYDALGAQPQPMDVVQAAEALARAAAQPLYSDLSKDLIDRCRTVIETRSGPGPR